MFVGNVTFTGGVFLFYIKKCCYSKLKNVYLHKSILEIVKNKALNIELAKQENFAKNLIIFKCADNELFFVIEFKVQHMCHWFQRSYN